MSDVSVVFTPTLSSITKISCNDTLFVVDVGDTNSVTLGDLNAVVTHTTYGSSSSVKVGTIVASTGVTPTITSSSAALQSHVTTLAVTGSNFGSEPDDVRVYLTPAAGTIILGTVDTSAAFSARPGSQFG